MTIRCARCNRILLRAPEMRGGMAFGPKCAAAVVGARPKRVRLSSAVRNVEPYVDTRQHDLFEGAPA